MLSIYATFLEAQPDEIIAIKTAAMLVALKSLIDDHPLSTTEMNEKQYWTPDKSNPCNRPSLLILLLSEKNTLVKSAICDLITDLNRIASAFPAACCEG
jgi:hypothetical protein